MATEQELNIAKEIAAVEKERLKIKKEQNTLDSDSVGLASSLVDSIKEIQGISTKRSTFDSNILKVNKEITKELLSQRRGLQSIESIDKQLAKNTDVIAKGKKLMLGLTSSLNAKESLRVQFANEQSQIIANEKNVQEDLLRIASEGGKIDEEALKASQERQDLAEVTLSIEAESLGALAKQAIFTKQNNDELTRQNKLRQKEKDTLEANEKKLGAFGGILKGISKIPLVGDLVDTEKNNGCCYGQSKGNWIRC